jgi:hypothetical protein
MKTTHSPKTSTIDAQTAETLTQLRPVKQAGAFLLLLFGTLIFALFMSSCGDDKNEDDLDAEFSEDNTTLAVSGEVNGSFKATGQLIEHFNSESQLYVSSFDFMESDDSDQSQFHITINRYADTPIELDEKTHIIDHSFLEEEETEGFVAVVMWWDNEDNATIYTEVENSSIKIEKITNTQVSGEFTINIKAVGYDETPASLSISGSFKVPRIKLQL